MALRNHDVPQPLSSQGRTIWARPNTSLCDGLNKTVYELRGAVSQVYANRIDSDKMPIPGGFDDLVVSRPASTLSLLCLFVVLCGFSVCLPYCHKCSRTKQYGWASQAVENICSWPVCCFSAYVHCSAFVFAGVFCFCDFGRFRLAQGGFLLA